MTSQALNEGRELQKSQDSQNNELRVYSTLQLQRKLMSLGIKVHLNTIIYYARKGIIVPDYVLFKSDGKRVSRYRFSEENVQRIIEMFKSGYLKNKNFVPQKTENKKENTKKNNNDNSNNSSKLDDFFALFEQ